MLAVQRTGVAAFEDGRWSEAIQNLRQAHIRLQALHQAAPRHRRLASQLGTTLVCLGSALKNERRPAEALPIAQEARRILEAIRHPSSEDLYGLARTYAMLAALAAPSPASPTSDEREALADRATEALRQLVAAGMIDFALIDRDHVLDPLRNRPDFHAFILDRGFPSNPFAEP